jgi:hypothetical protein
MILAAAPGRTVRIESVPGYHATVPAHQPPTYLDVLTSWDGQWYWGIVQHGYATSALDASGHPTQTNLAFFPLFPTLSKLVMELTAGSFAVVATTLSLVLGSVAAVLLFGLVRDAVDERRARVCVLLWCCFASAPVLQAAYTESLAMTLVAGALWLLYRRRYLWCTIPVLLLGLTRNLALVMVVVVAWVWLSRVRTQRGQVAPTARVPHGRLAVLALACVTAVALWPLLAALHTGQPTAYTTTVAAWPGFTGSVFVPAWVAAVVHYPALGVLLGLAILGTAAAVRLVPGRRRWGPELTSWAVVYPAYILGTTNPSFSFARYLLLAFPLGLLWAPDADSPTALRRQHMVVVLLAVVGLVAQWFWISKVLVYGGPHGGWGYP